MSIQTLFTVLSLFVAATSTIIAIVSYNRAKNKDRENEGKSEGVIASDIGYIKAGVDDLKRENRDTRKEVQALNERVTRCEESDKQAHKRIDTLSEYHKPHE